MCKSLRTNKNRARGITPGPRLYFLRNILLDFHQLLTSPTPLQRTGFRLFAIACGILRPCLRQVSIEPSKFQVRPGRFHRVEGLHGFGNRLIDTDSNAVAMGSRYHRSRGEHICLIRILAGLPGMVEGRAEQTTELAHFKRLLARRKAWLAWPASGLRWSGRP